MIDEKIKKMLEEQCEMLHNLIKYLNNKEKKDTKEIRLLNDRIDKKIKLLLDLERSNQPTSIKSLISFINFILEDIEINDIKNLVPKLKKSIEKFIEKEYEF